MTDDTWVCNYCGSEEVEQQVWININTLEVPDNLKSDIYWCSTCNDEVRPLTYFEWQEKIAEETMGNKEEYHKILDGSRM